MPIKVAILVCALSGAALAAPHYDRPTKLDASLSEHVRAAEQAWTAAEHERDPVKQVALWEQAAAAFAAVDGDPLDTKVKRAAAYAAVVAWKNALVGDLRTASPPVTTGEPERELKLIAALDRYIKYAAASDPELPGLLFIEAQTYTHLGKLELAIPIFRTILDRYRQDEVAEYAADHLLDAYNRLARFDQLVALADELAHDDQLMRARPDLALVVGRLQRQAGRKRLERLEAVARAEHDPDDYTAIGTGYLELYNTAPHDPEGDELLTNAATAFETARAIGSVIRALDLLERNYPNSKLAARGLARLGRIYAQIASYDKAADKLEQYAMKYAGEKDASDAMADAIYFRRGIGDRAKAITDTRYFIRTFSPRRPEDAANAMWSLTSLYEAEPDAVINVLLDYLHTFGERAGPERVVIARTKIGQLLWEQSCPIHAVDGLCAKANDHAARTCGAGTTRTLTMTARDPRKVKEALASFAAAIAASAHVPGPRGELVDAARYYVAQAKLGTADVELESYLALALPRGLDFDRGDRGKQTASQQRFHDWLDQKRQAGEKLRREYEAILAIKDGASSVTATERLGVILHSLATELVTGELPHGVRTGAHAADKREAYCDAMTEVARPVDAAAVEAFGVCLEKSTELSWFAESSAQCERELVQLAPDEFPRARELRIEPGLAAPVIDVEPPAR